MRVFAAVSAALFLSLAGCGGDSAGSSPNTIQWGMGTTVNKTVAVGTTVTWQSSDGAAHTVTSSGTPSFTELSVPAGGSAQMTFSTAGVYHFYCRIHGASSMSGTLTVQ